MNHSFRFSLLLLSFSCLLSVPLSVAAAPTAKAGEANLQTQQRQEAERAKVMSDELARRVAEESRKEAEAEKAAAAKQAADEAEAARRREQDRAKAQEAERQARIERERSCAIRPVMSNAEIAHCKEVWRE